MTVDLQKHAEAILRAAFPNMNFELTTIAAKQPRVLEACAALFDAGAKAMQEAVLDEQVWLEAMQDDFIPVSSAFCIDPASLRMKGHEHAAL